MTFYDPKKYKARGTRVVIDESIDELNPNDIKDALADNPDDDVVDDGDAANEDSDVADLFGADSDAELDTI